MFSYVSTVEVSLIYISWHRITEEGLLLYTFFTHGRNEEGFWHISFVCEGALKNAFLKPYEFVQLMENNLNKKNNLKMILYCRIIII